MRANHAAHSRGPCEKPSFSKAWRGAAHVSIDETLLGAPAPGIEVLALDEALTSLSRIDSRKARVVELRYFGGLIVEDTAEVLGVSLETAKRDWKMAKTWLLRELTMKKSRECL